MNLKFYQAKFIIRPDYVQGFRLQLHAAVVNVDCVAARRMLQQVGAVECAATLWQL